MQDGGADATSAASLDGVPSLYLGIRKQSGSNTIALINGVKERMNQIIPTLPPDMKVVVTRDQSEFIENSLHAIEEHLILGGLFAAVIVFLVSMEYPHDDYRGAGDSDFDHRGICDYRRARIFA